MRPTVQTARVHFVTEDVVDTTTEEEDTGLVVDFETWLDDCVVVVLETLLEEWGVVDAVVVE